MRIYRDKDDHRWYLEFEVPGTGLKSIAHFTNDWAQVIHWSQYNWRTFDFIKLYIEDDAMLGGYEIVAALLGLGFRIRFNLRQTERLKELQQRVEDIKSGKAETISIDEVISRLGGGKAPVPCDCRDCAVCGFPHMVCAKCNMCIMCHAHVEGCPGCHGELDI